MEDEEVVAEQERLVGELGAPEAARRRQAAERLRVLGGEDLKLLTLKAPLGRLKKAALTDPDEEVRTWAARAVLVRSWKLKFGALPFLERGLGSADEKVREASKKALVLCAERPHERESVAPVLVVPVVDALSSPALDEKKSALLFLTKLSELGADYDVAAPRLIELASDPDENVRAFAIDAMLGLPISVVAPADAALAKGTEDTNRWVQHATARLLARVRSRRLDVAGLRALTEHGSAAVREGALELLSPNTDEEAAALTPLLADRLGDPAGGVAFNAAKRLRSFALAGFDLTGIVPRLEGQLENGRYSLSGWVRDVDEIFANDLRGESPATDAICTLAAHHLWKGDLAAVERLIQRVQPDHAWLQRTALLELLEDAEGADELAANAPGIRKLLERYGPP